MRWVDTDEYTVMHMMGYGTNVFKLDMFREAFVNYNCDLPTLMYLANYYAETWGKNTDIKEVIAYLQSEESK